MKRQNCYAILLLCFASFSAVAEDATDLLPNPLPVYISGSTRVLTPALGFTKKLLPIDNTYTGNPGCYIVCYSHDKDKSVYAVGGDVYVVGQIRVAGTKKFDSCEPQLAAGQVVSTVQAFKDLCNHTFSTACGNQCWGGSQSW